MPLEEGNAQLCLCMLLHFELHSYSSCRWSDTPLNDMVSGNVQHPCWAQGALIITRKGT